MFQHLKIGQSMKLLLIRIKINIHLTVNLKKMKSHILHLRKRKIASGKKEAFLEKYATNKKMMNNLSIAEKDIEKTNIEKKI